MPQARVRTGYGRSTVYLRIHQGLWPRPIALGPKMVAWPEHEVEAINRARIAGKGDDAIRALVNSLHKERSKP